MNEIKVGSVAKMLFNILEKMKVSQIHILAPQPISYMTIDKLFNIP